MTEHIFVGDPQSGIFTRRSGKACSNLSPWFVKKFRGFFVWKRADTEPGGVLRANVCGKELEYRKTIKNEN